MYKKKKSKNKRAKASKALRISGFLFEDYYSLIESLKETKLNKKIGVTLDEV